MKIVIGSDHRGFRYKDFIKKNVSLPGRQLSWIDVGCSSEDRCDYPVFAHLVVKALQEKEAYLGVLLCGTGVGMSIAANRFHGIYAGLAWNEEVAKLIREHDNVNVLVLPADFVGPEQATAMIEAWISAEFSGEQHQKRIQMIDELGGV